METPILFLIFNRPDTTWQVFKQIRKARPGQLYLAADGARTSKENEQALCEKTRNLVLTNIDWDCEIKTLFRDQNLGSGRAVSQAINWFFEQVEEGIILEDDTLPDDSFFVYCEALLKKYRNDQRIMTISGTNLLGTWNNENYSYFYSKYAGNWGWASWRRAWKYFDFEISDWENPIIKRSLSESIKNKGAKIYFTKIFDQIKPGNHEDYWDYQWLFHRWKNSGLGTIPAVNLVINIGFGEHATHTFKKPDQIVTLQSYSLNLPMKFPVCLIQDEEYDNIYSNKFYLPGKKKAAFLKRLSNKLTSFIK